MSQSTGRFGPASTRPGMLRIGDGDALPVPGERASSGPARRPADRYGARPRPRRSDSTRSIEPGATAMVPTASSVALMTDVDDPISLAGADLDLVTTLVTSGQTESTTYDPRARVRPRPPRGDPCADSRIRTSPGAPPRCRRRTRHRAARSVRPPACCGRSRGSSRPARERANHPGERLDRHLDTAPSLVSARSTLRTSLVVRTGRSHVVCTGRSHVVRTVDRRGRACRVPRRRRRAACTLIPVRI